MAKVLILTLLFAPDGVSTAVLMTELAQALQTQGHEVIVLTTTPHYNVEPEARARQPLRPDWGRWLQRSELDGITVYHTSMPVKGDRVWTRVFDYLRFHLISTLAGLFAVGKFDLILVPSPPLTIGLSAWLLCRWRRVPFIYNVQEIYPDVAVSLGVLKNQLVRWALAGLERFVYRQARHITVISTPFRHHLLAKGVPATKLSVIPNFVDTDFIQVGTKANNFALAHGLADQFVVLYAGNIGLTQGFETILAAARQLQGLHDLRFVVVGDGTRRQWLHDQIVHAGLPNLLLLPYQPRSSVPQLYATSDLCLVPLKKDLATTTFPSKIYTIMAAGRPVVALADPNSELAWVVAHTGCGWVVPPDDATALAAAIATAYHERETLARRGHAGRAFVVAHHARPAVTAQYDTLIRRLTDTTTP